MVVTTVVGLAGEMGRVASAILFTFGFSLNALSTVVKIPAQRLLGIRRLSTAPISL